MRRFSAALIDVDGTLRGPDDFKPGALDLLTWLSDAGVPVALCSGRTVQSLEATASELPMVGYVAGGSGAVVRRRSADGWVTIGARHLTDAQVRGVLEVARASDMEAWIYTADDWFVEDAATAMVVQDFRITGARPSVARLDDVAGVIKMLVFATNPAQDAAVAGLRSDPRFTIVSSYPGYVDIVHADSSATKGGDFVLGDLGASWSDAVAIGDGENDLGMLSRAGVALCMPPLVAADLAPGASAQRRVSCANLTKAREYLQAL